MIEYAIKPLVQASLAEEFPASTLPLWPRTRETVLAGRRAVLTSITSVITRGLSIKWSAVLSVSGQLKLQTTQLCYKKAIASSILQCRRTNAPSGPHSHPHLLRAMPDDDFGALRGGQTGILGTHWRFGRGLIRVKAADSLHSLAVPTITERDA